MNVQTIAADNRGYVELQVPNVPSFLGSSVHCQAMVLHATGQLVLSNPSELVVRG